jgi:hypothetical protein
MNKERDWEIEFKKSLEKAEEALHKAEDILKEANINIPEENIELEVNEKIWLPSGYIRRIDVFSESYQLNKILSDDNMIKNIGYALQASDLTNYLINRFNIGLSVGAIFYKLAIINLFSIIEGILYGVSNELHKFCFIEDEICSDNLKCEYYIKNFHEYSFRELIKCFDEKSILKLGDEGCDLLLSLKDLRDHIHIWDVKENEYLDDIYNLSSYNTLIKVLYFIKEELPQNYFYFIEGRKNNCTINNKDEI